MKKTTTNTKQEQSVESENSGTQNKITRKKKEIISDSGSRDDDDAGDYDDKYRDESRKDAKGSLYNSDENKEFQQRENDFRKGDKNQLNAQRNSSNTVKGSTDKSDKTKSAKSK